MQKLRRGVQIDLEVLIVEDLSHNLLSISCLERRGYSITFSNGQCLISEGRIPIAVGAREVGLYEMMLSVSVGGEVSMLTKED